MTLSTDIQSMVGGDSRDTLLRWLQENPKTLGWDAIVVYNRSRVNALLIQQYINKLTAENYLTPIDGYIEGPKNSKLTFFGIQLGLPVLSFENADLEHSNARVTQAITAGLAILRTEPTGGYKGVHSIMRPNGAVGPFLWMDVDLRDAPGSASDAGVVQLDLTRMSGFDTDLFSDQISTINAQEFFLERFKEKPELQVYTLGVLNNSADSMLAPQNFIVRTQPAPGAQNRAAPNYGDGAVVVLVTLKDGKDGGAPTKDTDFKYLIPNDDNGSKYSSAVLLSNKVLFARLFLNSLHTLLPGTTLTPKTLTNEHGVAGHIYLEYTDGAITKSDYKYVNSGVYHNYIVTASSPLITIPLKGAQLQASNNTICFKWMNKSFIINMHYHNTRGDLSDTHSDETVEMKVNFNVFSNLMIDPESGIIHFEQEDIISAQIEIDMEYAHYPYGMELFEGSLVQIVKDKLFAFTRNITLPDIDTFLLRNLLFPDNNLMVLTDAHVPGDLAVFGNVAPTLTSFVIEPERAILNPGSTRAFTVEPAATVTWSVKGLPGNSLPVGSITNEGVYTALTADELLGHDSQQVIITATGTTSRGLATSSSTLVSIVSQTISLNPIFSIAGPGTSLKFTAGTIDGRTLQWAMKDPGQNGKLEPTTGSSTTYTAPELQTTGMFTREVIQVTDDQGNMGQAEVLVINKVLGGQVEVDLTDAANGKAQLQFVKDYDGNPAPVPSKFLVWTLLAGAGWVNAEGIYSEPQQQLPGFAIITCAFTHTRAGDEPTITDYGYTVLPLPLSQYPELTTAFQ
ncbi:hypothetical protein ALQ04_04528 [Pseudomonas cichorii]|uniref:Uncharacterized protein n=1 Tax=Pseudomonas cichorii TaxID=36746 RepID=A0A3M4M9U6_PSECI|nr:hypothetical protein [Pseudomonas cichorii]RMQ50647.1 hypothetical protein ALQ04_04528 [Pseudomonas cichorii]